MTVEEIEKWLKDRRKNIIDPDDMSWDDMGCTEEFGKIMEAEFGSKEAYMEHGGDNEYDERDQVELQMIDELLNLIKGGNE